MPVNYNGHLISLKSATKFSCYFCRLMLCLASACATTFPCRCANQIDGFVTAREVADIHFFSRKQFRGEENIDQKVRKIISGILALFDIVDTLGEDCRNAFGIENNDYEDAIMISSVQRAGMDYIVTRNTEHFAKSPVPVCTPTDFVKLINHDRKTDNDSAHSS